MNDHYLEGVSLTRESDEEYSYHASNRLALRTVDELALPKSDRSKPVLLEVEADEESIQIGLSGDQLGDLIDTLVRISTAYDERHDRLFLSEEEAASVPPEHLPPEAEVER